MIEPQIDEPQNGQDHSDVVMAEFVQPRGSLLPCAIAAALICVFLVVDFFTPRCFLVRGTSEQLLMALLLGLAIGQVNLIAVWTSLAPGNIVLRVSWSLLLTMAMWYSLILGSRLDLRWLAALNGPSWRPRMTREDAIFLIAILLAGVAILQIPLWVAKKVFRWRLTRQPGDTEASRQEDRQFNLQHLLIAMFLLAVALSPLRHVLPAPDPGDIPSRRPDVCASRDGDPLQSRNDDSLHLVGVCIDEVDRSVLFGVVVILRRSYGRRIWMSLCLSRLAASGRDD